jgi:tripartite-type tricarboxylate transporter receptor subunit TctC
MTYIVATEAGGGYDTYGRLVAKYLGRHLGLSKIIVKNIPGDGHIAGANALYAARPDGLTIGTFNTGLVYAQLLGLEQVKFDLGKMSWIGKASDEPRLLVVSTKTGYRSIDDIRNAGRPLVVASAGFGSSSYNDMRLLAKVFHLDVRFIFGLATRDAQLAMKRGEVDAQFGSASSHRPFLVQKYGRALLRVGSGPGVADSIPDAAALASTDESKAAIALVRSQATLLRMTAGPPGIPGDRLLALREAYTAALRDPALLAEARKLDIPIVPMDGSSLAVRVREALAQPPAIVAMIAEAAVGTTTPIVKSTATLVAVAEGERAIRFLVNEAEVTAKLDPTQVSIKVDGKTTPLSGLVPGMICEMSYDADADHALRELACRSAP